MKPFGRAGFSLIELLTVIAIIAILSALSMTIGPRIIERSKWVHFKTTCNQLKNSFALYATKDPVKNKATFPPTYGFHTPRKTADVTPEDDAKAFFYKPYLAYIDFFGDEQVYDKFQNASYDTDGDNKISLLEFCPMGHKQPGGGYVFDTADDQPLYDEANLPAEVSRMVSAHRPYVYIPVDSSQAQKVRDYWGKRVAGVAGRELEAGNALHWLPAEVFANTKPGEVNNPIASLGPGRFPPQKYDDFVLITPGPSNNTGGILTAPDSFMNDIADYSLSEQYHVLALRAFFLATRDMSDSEEEPGMDMLGNGKFDFDARNRARGVDGKAASYKIPDLYKLPNGSAGEGPGIYQCNYPDGA